MFGTWGAACKWCAHLNIGLIIFIPKRSSIKFQIMWDKNKVQAKLTCWQCPDNGLGLINGGDNTSSSDRISSPFLRWIWVQFMSGGDGKVSEVFIGWKGCYLSTLLGFNPADEKSQCYHRFCGTKIRRKNNVDSKVNNGDTVWQWPNFYPIITWTGLSLPDPLPYLRGHSDLLNRIEHKIHYLLQINGWRNK